jgi:hypothetical protein
VSTDHWLGWFSLGVVCFWVCFFDVYLLDGAVFGLCGMIKGRMSLAGEGTRVLRGREKGVDERVVERLLIDAGWVEMRLLRYSDWRLYKILRRDCEGGIERTLFMG